MPFPLQFFNPGGAHSSGLIGEDPHGQPGFRFGDDYLDDYPTHDGTCVRDYLHILDLASGHPLALDAFAPGLTAFDNCPTPALPKMHNLSRGQGTSMLQILEAMHKATGFDYRYNIMAVGAVMFLLDERSIYRSRPSLNGYHAGMSRVTKFHQSSHDHPEARASHRCPFEWRLQFLNQAMVFHVFLTWTLLRSALCPARQLWNTDACSITILPRS